MAKKKKGTEHMRQFEEPTSQPVTSPYTDFPIALRVGPDRTEFYVPHHQFLRNSGRMVAARATQWSNEVELPDVDEATGHVLAHYLHTGTYQTLKSVETYLAEVDAEFTKAFVAYNTAKTYEIPELQQLAINAMEKFGAAMTIWNVLGAINEDFSKLTGDISWFEQYLITKFEDAFEEDFTIFATGYFFDHVSNMDLYKFSVNCVMGLYSNRVSRMLYPEQRNAKRGIRDMVKKPIKNFIGARYLPENSIKELVSLEIPARGGPSPAGAGSGEDGDDDEDTGRQEDDSVSVGSTVSEKKGKQAVDKGKEKEKEKENEDFQWADQPNDVNIEHEWKASKTAELTSENVKAVESAPLAFAAVTATTSKDTLEPDDVRNPSDSAGPKTVPSGFDETENEAREKEASALREEPKSKPSTVLTPTPEPEIEPEPEKPKVKAAPRPVYLKDIMAAAAKDPKTTVGDAALKEPHPLLEPDPPAPELDLEPELEHEPESVKEDNAWVQTVTSSAKSTTISEVQSEASGPSSVSTAVSIKKRSIMAEAPSTNEEPPRRPHAIMQKPRELPNPTNDWRRPSSLPPASAPPTDGWKTTASSPPDTPKPYKKTKKPAKDAIPILPRPAQPQPETRPPPPKSNLRASAPVFYSPTYAGDASRGSTSSGTGWAVTPPAPHINTPPSQKKAAKKSGGGSKKGKKDFARPFPPSPNLRPDNNLNAQDWPRGPRSMR